MSLVRYRTLPGPGKPRVQYVCPDVDFDMLDIVKMPRKVDQVFSGKVRIQVLLVTESIFPTVTLL